MTRFATLFFSLLFAVTLFACSKQEATPQTTETETLQEQTGQVVQQGAALEQEEAPALEEKTTEEGNPEVAGQPIDEVAEEAEQIN